MNCYRLKLRTYRQLDATGNDDDGVALKQIMCVVSVEKENTPLYGYCGYCCRHMVISGVVAGGRGNFSEF